MLLLETIRTSNQRLENIAYHNERFNRSRAEIFDSKKKLDLRKLIKIPSHLSRSVHKCRVIYGPDIQRIEFVLYQPKKINSLELVTVHELDYGYKFADRSHLKKLLENSSADEIIMVKNGFVTDASYANLCFFDGEKWLTPSTPLLPGTMRAKLIDQQKIHVAEIRVSDLRFFKKIKFINAMLIFENTPTVEVKKIIR